MLTFLSSILCTSKIHPFSLEIYLGTSLVIGNLMVIRVTSVEWTYLGLEWPPNSLGMVDVAPPIIKLGFLLKNSIGIMVLMK